MRKSFAMLAVLKWKDVACLGKIAAALAAFAVIGGARMCFALDSSVRLERLMKDCLIPEVSITREMDVCEAFHYFRDNPLIATKCREAGCSFALRFKAAADWKVGSNGTKIPPPAVPYQAKNVTFYYALKKVCQSNGYRFRIQDGVVRVFANSINETQPRNWTSTKGTMLYGRLIGLLATGEGVVIRRERDKELIPALYKNLSSADRSVVTAPGEKDFLPYYYQYGYKKWLRTDHIICSPEEASREQDYISRAASLIESKSYFKKCDYRVFQCLDDGALCVMWNGEAYRGEIFAIPSTDVADEDRYTADFLLWLGTYTYDTAKGGSRTVNIYSSCNIFAAVDYVRGRQGFYDTGDSRFEQATDEDRPDTEGKGTELVGSGSGVMITRNGYLLTAAHVVKSAAKVVVCTVKGEKPARIVRVDRDNDLALLKIEGEYRPISFSSRRKERLGASVFTLGFPRPELQGFEPKVTQGVISGMEGYRGDVKTYQIDAAIQPGNSGGLLADPKGNLVGIVCAFLAFAGSGETIPQNVNYAIKKSYVLAFVDSVPECSEAINETEEAAADLEAAVSLARESCALIKVYR